MIKKYYWILLAFVMCSISNAQQVVTTAGESMTNNTVQVNWTIGEPITEVSTNGKTTVTPGLNQPLLTIETSVENIKNKIGISIFPNPTSQFINIKYDGLLPAKIKILSINGTVLSIKELKAHTMQLDFSKNENGIYVIEIIDNSAKSNIYRIVKQ